MQIDDGRRLYHQLDPVLAALVFTLKNHNPVASIDQLLWLDPVLSPNLVVLRIEGLGDLAEATQDFALLQAPDGPMELGVRIDQIRHSAPIPALQEFICPPHYLHVLLRHRPRSISRRGFVSRRAIG